MKRLSFKTDSIFIKIMVPMIAIMLVQAGIFFVTVLWGGTVEQLEQNSFDIVNEKVSSRKNYLENEMIQRWSNLNSTASGAVLTIEQALAKEGADSSELTANSRLSMMVLERASADLIDLLRRNSVTGVFLILAGDPKQLTGESEFSGLYIRDLDPSSNSKDNADLLVDRAPSFLTKSLGIPLDTQWTPQFNLSSEDVSDSYFYKPILAAYSHPEIGYKDLGYWSLPFRLNQSDGDECISYSIPLIGTGGKIYGVMGVELQTEYIRKALPNSELATDKKGSYLLAVEKSDDLVFENVLVNGPILKQLIGDRKQTVLVPRAGGYFELKKNERVRENVYACVQYLTLYNTNTPFAADRWALVGVVEEDTLLSFTLKVRRMLVIALTLSLSLGIISILVVSGRFSKPVVALVRKVLESDPSQPVSLDKIGIAEIDELCGAIESLSRDVVDSASRLSKIITLADISIGAFECPTDGKKVFCSANFFAIFGVHDVDTSSGFVERDLFFERLQGLDGCIESREEEKNTAVYEIGKPENRHWIRLKVVVEESRILGVASDITPEVLEKKKIEYERDYDLLTNLLNRRAFHTNMQRLFSSPEQLGISALLMIDLDNLKYLNDTYGHDYGDEYIRCAANALKKYTPFNTLVARMSGDEFHVFIYGYDSKDEIRSLISSIRAEMQFTSMPVPGNENYPLRASVGLAWYPDDSTSYEMLIKYADFAMYKVKNTIKGEMSEFNLESYNKDSYLLHSKEELNQLLDHELIRYQFQPIVDVRTAEVFAYEALMRPISKTLKSPMELLTLARSQSKLGQVERLTWFKTLSTFQSQIRSFPPECRLFVNSIPNQCLTEQDAEELEERFCGVLPRVVLELTEEEKLDEALTERKKGYIKRWGCKIALDDFGTGYNGEAALLLIQPDLVKIDISIVRDIDHDKNRRTIFQNLATYCRERGIKTIAEGVETKGEMEVVIQCGADYIQGYYLGKPSYVPAQIEPQKKQELLSLGQQKNEGRFEARWLSKQ